ncbi:hypothetical protein OAM34_03900, partial [Alphaproteobacteria bacterium]|nr:hypothetical protein [Alphaproteobacteria bacterium]
MHVLVDGQVIQKYGVFHGPGRYIRDLILHQINVIPEAKITILLNGNAQDEYIYVRNFFRVFSERISFSSWFGHPIAPEFNSGFNQERQINEHILRKKICELRPSIFLTAGLLDGLDFPISPFRNYIGINAKTIAVFHTALSSFKAKKLYRSKSRTDVYRSVLHTFNNFDFIICPSDYDASLYQEIVGKTNFEIIPPVLTFFNQSTFTKTNFDVEQLEKDIKYIFCYRERMALSDCFSVASAILNLKLKKRLKLGLIFGGEINKNDIIKIKKIWDENGLDKNHLLFLGPLCEAERQKLIKQTDCLIDPSLLNSFDYEKNYAQYFGKKHLSYSGLLNHIEAQASIGNVSLNIVDLLEKNIFEKLIKQTSPSPLKVLEVVGANGTEKITNNKKFTDICNNLVKSKSFVSDGSTENKQNQNKRIIFDATHSAKTQANTGIQRVVRSLGTALVQKPMTNGYESLISFIPSNVEPYKIFGVSREYLNFDPIQKINIQSNDVYIFYDSTWNNLSDQLKWIKQAIIQGNKIIFGIHDLIPIFNSGF